MIWTVMNMRISVKIMRLINADKLKEAINSSLNTGRETFSPEIIYEAVDEQPTAFDVDKVVEQLKKLADEANDKILEAGGLQLYYDGYEDAMRTAVEIVEGGGVE
uniref:Uncharacterized protein n=1 Tax=Siphoviridae sp. ctVif31 TaxID=2825532 RepID=A0A8S5Q4N7_9CAUD|nr:MAG TPA: hypothetical protein [Siphoviridae sp. ctVif31]